MPVLNDKPEPMPQQDRLPPEAAGLGSFILFWVAVATLICAGYTAFGPGPLTEDKDVIIPHGIGTWEIGQQLTKEHVISSPWLFALASKLPLAAGALKAGEYHFTKAEPLVLVLSELRSGQIVVHKVTVTEGMSSSLVVAALKADKVLTGTIADPPAEGTLLPDTYLYERGEDRQAVIRRMQDAMKKVVDEFWPLHKPDLPIKTPEEMVIMASIIERETPVAEERPAIAGVFYNRLRAGMKLQADPTVVYAITHGERALGRELTHEDMLMASPYNTYFIEGLPPTPIGNPSRDSIAAAALPEKHDYLYFVVTGHGGHVFAKTLEEHDANIARWREANRLKLATEKAESAAHSLVQPPEVKPPAAAPPNRPAVAQAPPFVPESPAAASPSAPAPANTTAKP